jgi:hypothetical protein
VTAVNDAPSFTKGVDQTVNEDAVRTKLRELGVRPISVRVRQTRVLSDADRSRRRTIITRLFSAQPSVAVNGNVDVTPGGPMRSATADGDGPRLSDNRPARSMGRGYERPADVHNYG